MAARRRFTELERRELVLHAEMVREQLAAIIAALSDPTRGEIDDADVAFVERAFKGLFKKRDPWQRFVVCLDHATVRWANDDDTVCARHVRVLFAAWYPAAAAKLDDTVVVAAVSAWRGRHRGRGRGTGHWVPVRTAILSFEREAPTLEQMRKAWTTWRGGGATETVPAPPGFRIDRKPK